MHGRICALILTMSALCGCSDPMSASIAEQLSASKGQRVDLGSAIEGNWDRVCVLGPYSTDADAAEALGFSWPAEALTDIARNDGISLLVFVREKSVLKFVEHPRGSGDFSNLRGRCFARESAKFVQIAHPTKGWPGLFPADEK